MNNNNFDGDDYTPDIQGSVQHAELNEIIDNSLLESVENVAVEESLVVPAIQNLHESLDLSEESLKELESLREKYKECKILKECGDTENLYVAYTELKDLTEDMCDNSFEKQRFIIRLRQIKADLAVMCHREAEEALKKSIVKEKMSSDSEIAFSSSVILDMLPNIDDDDYMVHSMGDPEITNQIGKTDALLYRTKIDESFSDLRGCYSELKKLLAKLNNEEVNVKIKKMSAAMRLFVSVKASTDFHMDQLFGEIKMVESSGSDNSSMDVHCG